MSLLMFIAVQIAGAALEPTHVRQSQLGFSTRSQVLLHTNASAFELTPEEMQLAIERRRALEEARDTNIDARRQAREVADEVASMSAEAIDAGLLVTFGDDAFVQSSKSLSSTANRRLEAVTSFLRRHPSSKVTVLQSPGSQSAETSSVVDRRKALLAHYLQQANVATSRTKPSVDVDSPSDSARDIQMLIEDPLPLWSETQPTTKEFR